MWKEEGRKREREREKKRVRKRERERRIIAFPFSSEWGRWCSIFQW
jgi:hypothetical protein